MAQPIPMDQLIKLVFKEVAVRRTMVTVLFVIVSLLVLGAGFVLPKKYTSTTTIVANNSNIIAPLMDGAAVPTEMTVSEEVVIEVVFSRRLRDQLLEYGGWLEEDLSQIDRERVLESIKGRTIITKESATLIKIKYVDSDPVRSFKVTQKLASLYVAESGQSKREESQEAYDFIDKQVKSYEAKLKEAERKINAFKAKNEDALPGTGDSIGSRIENLKASIEKMDQEVKEAKIRKKSLEKQLSGEVKVTASFLKENQYRGRITELQGQLDTLRLSYHDSYPDIVGIKKQIADLEGSIEGEVGQRDPNAGSASNSDMGFIGNGGATPANLSQQMRGQLSETKTLIATLNGRQVQAQKSLIRERDRAGRVRLVESKIDALVRDYEVNKELYKDLLQRREMARISMHLDIEKQGLKFSVQEPAALPLVPTGLRFLHILMLGPLIGLVLPIALIYVLLAFLDSRIRLEPGVAFVAPEGAMVTTIGHMISPQEERSHRRGSWLIALVVMLVLMVYVVAGGLKLMQVL